MAVRGQGINVGDTHRGKAWQGKGEKKIKLGANASKGGDMGGRREGGKKETVMPNLCGPRREKEKKRGFEKKK